MATSYWRGDAQPVAQINTITVGGTAAVSQVYTVTINRKTVTYTASGTDTNATIAEALQALLATCTFPEFQEVSWSYAGTGSVILGTATNPGTPFTNTSGATGTGTLVTAISTASSGPNDASVAANYSPNSVPVNGDTLIVEQTASSILYGLTTLSGVSLAAFQVPASFTGQIGLPTENQTGYVEYRATTLLLGGNPTVTVGDGEGQGSSLIRVRVGTGTCNVLVQRTGSAPSNAPNALMLTNAGGNNTLTVLGGDVGIAVGPSETAEFATVAVGGGSTLGLTAPALTIGPGATIGTSVELNSGDVLALADVPLLSANGGTYVQEAGTLESVECYAGSVIYRSVGTTTSAVFNGPTAVCDCRQDPRTRTFTDCTFIAGAILYDPSASVTFTNPASFDTESLTASVLGSTFTIQRTP